ncbi:hypothetical protein V6N13_089154 [Hibiscus sabdariffa]
MDVVIDAQGDGSDVVLETTVEDCMHCDEGGVERVVDSLQNSGTIPNLPKPSFRDMSTGKGTTLSPSPQPQWNLDNSSQMHPPLLRWKQDNMVNWFCQNGKKVVVLQVSNNDI